MLNEVWVSQKCTLPRCDGFCQEEISSSQDRTLTRLYSRATVWKEIFDVGQMRMNFVALSSLMICIRPDHFIRASIWIPGDVGGSLKLSRRCKKEKLRRGVQFFDAKWYPPLAFFHHLPSRAICCKHATCVQQGCVRTIRYVRSHVRSHVPSAIH